MAGVSLIVRSALKRQSTGTAIRSPLHPREGPPAHLARGQPHREAAFLADPDVFFVGAPASTL